MSLVPNVTKQRLQSNKIAFGMSLRMARTMDVPRAAASSGYHYISIDLEHSAMPLDVAAQFCTVGLDAGVTPIVRLPTKDARIATPLLDAGCQGIIVPHVNNADDIREAISVCRYPPYGGRSIATCVQAGWRKIPVATLGPMINDNVLMIALLESWEAIENVEEIAAVEGVDILSIGSNDLLTDMGIPGGFDHPRVIEAYEAVIAAARRNGKWTRIGGIFEPQAVRRSIALGSRMVTLDNDFRYLLRAMRASVDDISSGVDPALV